MSRKLIELKNIVKNFGKNEIIKDISLDVYEGEFLTLLGPSGCGKTTILRMLAGFETPTSGEILLDGEDLIPVPANRRQINTVFQSYALFPHMTVRGNIAYGMKMKHIPDKEIKERVEEMLSLTQLESLADRKPAQLSGGQQQRVAIARSLVNRPKVLLLDEPLGALDLHLRKSMQIELKRLQRKLGTTYVYVTHDQEEAMTMSDRVVVMHEGRIEQCDTARQIYKHPATRFVSQFLGDANLFTGTYVHGDGEAYFCQDDGAADTYAVRPEKLHFVPDSSKGMTAVVTESTFMGNVYRNCARLESGQICFALNDRPYNPGTKVKILFAPEDACRV